MKKRLRALLLGAFIAAACASPKNSFDKGEYTKAFSKSVSRLQKDPTDRKALAVLKDAFDFAVNDHLRIINEAKLSNDVYRWEKVAREYQAINALINQLNYCPACLKIIGPVQSSKSAESEAFLKAADVRYDLAEKEIIIGYRENARSAYEHYMAAEELYPGYKDARQKAQDAYWEATVKVLVEDIPVKSRAFSLSNEFFREQVWKYLNNLSNRNNSFVAFYTAKDFNQSGLKQPDQVLQLSFDEYIVGNTYVKENNFEMKKDSVVVGKIDGRNAYGTVKAKVKIFRKEVSTSGALNLRLTDARTNNVVFQDRLPGTFVWAHEWGSFNGDERALTKDQLSICNRKEILPPPPQDLFVEFTRPIYDQLTNKLKRYYAN
ncbi:hypothetical protein [Solitalea lacus]|uniref:hypothetical protein n=1 Tax=Solitalea lacus TaxID=2911172 RepID=UPI001EDA64DC|nr:hypothetical protein [Solitalea lacus]UKJ07635.1 hypothetical protein L2B55_00375 [Solitalea lacus]